MSRYYSAFSSISGFSSCALIVSSLLSNRWLYTFQANTGLVLESSLFKTCFYVQPLYPGKNIRWLYSLITSKLNFDEGGIGGTIQTLVRQTCHEYENFTPYHYSRFFGDLISLIWGRYMLAFSAIAMIIGCILSLVYYTARERNKLTIVASLFYVLGITCMLLTFFYMEVFFTYTIARLSYLLDVDLYLHSAYYFFVIGLILAIISFIFSIIAVKSTLKELRKNSEPIAMRVRRNYLKSIGWKFDEY